MTSSQALSKPLRYLCIFGQCVAVLLILISIWLFFDQNVIDRSLDAYWARLSDSSREVMVYSDLKKTLLVAIATIAFFAPHLVLVGAFRVFDAFRKGSPFRQETVRSVRFLGTTILAYALSKIVSYTIIVLILTYDNPPGTKELSISFDGHTLVSLMIGLIIIVVGHILVEATKIAEENRQFI